MESIQEAVDSSDIISVMLIEDHPSYRRAVKRAIDSQNAMKLVSVFGTAETALASLQKLDQSDAPCIILLDLNLPGMNGLAVISQMLALAPSAKIIILTQSNADSDIRTAILAGASGYLLKSSTFAQIVEGIETVASGGASLDGDITLRLMKMVQSPHESKDSEAGSHLILSTREKEILRLLGRGMVKKEIAGELNISYGTVATYIRRLYEKFGVQNAAAAIDLAHRLGIFQDEDDQREK